MEHKITNEATVQDAIRLESPKTHQGILWRNNSGVLQDKHNRPVRYGLANDSARLNAVVKSSDLIGITPIVITPEMVGKTIGVFTAIECKPENFSYNPNNKHLAAQQKYHDIVTSLGGIAGFTGSVLKYKQIVYEYYKRLTSHDS